MDVRMFTVGIGRGAGIPLHVNGFNVFTRLDEPTLQAIAQITGGTVGVIGEAARESRVS